MAKLTAAARKKIPAKDFAGPDKSYPIPDASHARNALARASGKPVDAAVKAKVRAKFPGIKVGGKGGGSKKRRVTSDGYMNR